MEPTFYSDILRKLYNKLFIYSILLIISFVIFSEVRKRTKFRSITKKIRTQFGLPFLGIGYKFLQVNKLLHILGSIFEQQRVHTMFSWLGPHPMIVTQDCNLIEHVLNSNDFLEKSSIMYQCFRNIFGQGLIASSVPKWKHNRKLINYFFNRKNIINSLPVFVDALKVTLNKLDDLCGKDKTDVFEALKYAPIISTVAIAYGNTENFEDILQDSVYIAKHLELDLYLSPVGLNFLAHPKRYKNLPKQYEKYLKDLTSNMEQNTDYNANPTPYPIYLNLVYELYKRGDFTADDVVDEMMTLTQASFDVGYKALCAAVVLLAMHPAEQQKAYEEIVAIYPCGEMNFQYDDLKSMPYLNMIINESLRLFPSVPVIARQATCETQLSDGIIVPNGMEVAISIYTLHRRKDIWGDDAELFKPEHCHPDKLSKMHSYALIPFSKGARGCIGWRYANLALRLFLVGMLRDFKFSCTYKYADVKYRPDVLINKRMLKVERR